MKTTEWLQLLLPVVIAIIWLAAQRIRFWWIDRKESKEFWKAVDARMADNEQRYRKAMQDAFKAFFESNDVQRIIKNAIQKKQR